MNSTLLHIDASARTAESESRQLSQRFVTQWRQAHPTGSVVARDIVATPLPHLDQALLSGLMTAADQHSPAQSASASRVDELVTEFMAADVIVLGVPMYNFGIPSTLKAWIDHIAIAGRTFRYTAAGPEGLSGGKSVYVISARDGAYGEGPMDHQVSYLRTVFGFLGIDDLSVIQAEGLGMSADVRERALTGAFDAIDDAFAAQVAA